MFSHYSHSKVFKVWCIVLVVMVFIIGIVAGFIFKVPSERIYYEDHFNLGLAVIIWLSDVIPAAILYAVYSHLENQEIQINNLNQIRQTLSDFKFAAKDNSHTVNTPSNFKKYDNEDKTWTCSKCGRSNPVGAERCSYCDYKNI